MPGPRLSDDTKRRIRAHQREAVKRILISEELALAILAQPLAHSTDRLIAEVARRSGAPSEVLRRAALVTIQSETEALSASFTAAAKAARERAREQARGQLAFELAGVAWWIQTAQTGETVPELVALPEGPELDGARAAAAGAAMAARWAALAGAQLTLWRQRDGGAPSALVPRLAAVGPAAAPRLRVHAAAQAVDAYADEQVGFWRMAARPALPRPTPAAALPSPAPTLPVLAPPAPAPARRRPVRGEPARARSDRGGSTARRLDPLADTDDSEPGLPHGWRHAAQEIWVATLDLKTCPRCWESDGQMVPIGKHWTHGRMPLHPLCRCVPITVIVPEAVQRKLPGMQIDYTQLKADIRETMLTSPKPKELLGKQHALGYFQDTAKTSSPEALTKRLRSPRDYFDHPPRPRAPSLRNVHPR